MDSALKHTEAFRHSACSFHYTSESGIIEFPKIYAPTVYSDYKNQITQSGKACANKEQSDQWGTCICWLSSAI